MPSRDDFEPNVPPRAEAPPRRMRMEWPIAGAGLVVVGVLIGIGYLRSVRSVATATPTAPATAAGQAHAPADADGSPPRNDRAERPLPPAGGDGRRRSAGESGFSDEESSPAAALSFLDPLEKAGGGKRPPWKKGPRVTAVNFWATWCGPCMREIPELEALQNKMGERGVEVILVNIDLEDIAAVEKFLARRGITLPCLLDRRRRLWKSLETGGVPTTVLFDASGKRVGTFVGRVPIERLEEEVIRHLP